MPVTHGVASSSHVRTAKVEDQPEISKMTSTVEVIFVIFMLLTRNFGLETLDIHHGMKKSVVV